MQPVSTLGAQSHQGEEVGGGRRGRGREGGWARGRGGESERRRERNEKTEPLPGGAENNKLYFGVPHPKINSTEWTGKAATEEVGYWRQAWTGRGKKRKVRGEAQDRVQRVSMRGSQSHKAGRGKE